MGILRPYRTVKLSNGRVDSSRKGHCCSRSGHGSSPPECSARLNWPRGTRDTDGVVFGGVEIITGTDRFAPTGGLTDDEAAAGNELKALKTDDAPDGGTYTWTVTGLAGSFSLNGQTQTATGQEVVYHPSKTGQGTATVTYTKGSFSATDSVDIHGWAVVPDFKVTPDDDVCWAPDNAPGDKPWVFLPMSQTSHKIEPSIDHKLSDSLSSGKVTAEDKWSKTGPALKKVDAGTDGDATATAVHNKVGTSSIKYFAFDKYDRDNMELIELGDTHVLKYSLIDVNLEMQQLAEENDDGSNTPHETDPGAYIGLNINDNAGAEGVVDTAESGFDEADPDLQQLTVEMSEAVPYAGTVKLTVPSAFKLWTDARKTEEVTARSWDLGDEDAHTAFKEAIDGGLWVEAREAPDNAQSNADSEIELTYGKAPSFTRAVTDKVKLNVLQLDITRVPDYLFANACYATPITWEVIGAASSDDDKGADGGQRPYRITKVTAFFTVDGEQRFG